MTSNKLFSFISISVNLSDGVTFLVAKCLLFPQCLVYFHLESKFLSIVDPDCYGIQTRATMSKKELASDSDHERLILTLLHSQLLADCHAQSLAFSSKMKNKFCKYSFGKSLNEWLKLS